MKNINDMIVERICKFVGEKDLTQYRLAQLSGVPFPTIKSIMQRRTKNISLKTVIMIANGLGLTASEFLDDEGFSVDNLDIE